MDEVRGNCKVDAVYSCGVHRNNGETHGRGRRKAFRSAHRAEFARSYRREAAKRRDTKAGQKKVRVEQKGAPSVIGGHAGALSE